ncbi:MAG: formimidoylglutamase [Bdellovibrionia bacterium]
MKLQSTPSELFFSRNDTQDLRLGDLVTAKQSHSQPTHSLWGYADDEGIQLNGGRIGASGGPNHVRKVFYKCTPANNSSVLIHDFGNLTSEAGSLHERHAWGRKQITQEFAQKRKVITLGGGHDYGYSDASGFNDFYRGQPRVLINFDAHLDVRPYINDVAHSGTPFRRVLEEFSQDQLSFFELGIQKQCNSLHHWKWAQEQGAKIFALTDRHFPWQKIKDALLPFCGQPLFVSFDIDALAAHQAPGCSQSWPSGLDLNEVLSFMDFLSEHFSWQGLGIYEVAPSLDVDNITAKSAALLLHRFLYPSKEQN